MSTPLSNWTCIFFFCFQHHYFGLKVLHGQSFLLLDLQQNRSYEKRWNCLPLAFRVLKKVGKHSPREPGKTIRNENPPEGVFWFHIQCQQEHLFASEYATLSNWVSLKTDTFPYITFEFFFLCMRSKNLKLIMTLKLHETAILKTRSWIIHSVSRYG